MDVAFHFFDEWFSKFPMSYARSENLFYAYIHELLFLFEYPGGKAENPKSSLWPCGKSGKSTRLRKSGTMATMALRKKRKIQKGSLWPWTLHLFIINQFICYYLSGPNLLEISIINYLHLIEIKVITHPHQY